MLLRHTGFRKLCLARERLRDVADEAPTIEAIAAEVGISPAHFIRQFAALFGETPHQFRMRARVALARRLLAAGDRSVTDVCMEVGCSSLGSFSSLFTRLTGESPSAYRRRLRTLATAPAERQRVLHPGCLTLLGQLPTESQFSRSTPRAVLPDSASTAMAPGSDRCVSD